MLKSFMKYLFDITKIKRIGIYSSWFLWQLSFFLLRFSVSYRKQKLARKEQSLFGSVQSVTLMLKKQSWLILKLILPELILMRMGILTGKPHPSLSGERHSALFTIIDYYLIPIITDLALGI
jgi:hypothetical protein